MYNENIKLNYIATRPESMRANIKNFFEASEKDEEALGKDIACFSRDEFAAHIESLGFMEPQTLRDMIAKFAVYGDWYARLHPNTEPHFRDYHVEDFPYAKRFKPLVIETPEKLCAKIQMVYTIDSGQPAMAALCLAWLGIDCGDAIKLTNDQVDTIHGQILSPTGEVLVASMPECIRKMLNVYKNTTTAGRMQNQPITVKADDLGFFIKRMISKKSSHKGKPVTKKNVSDWIVILRDKYNGTTGNDQTLNYGNVQRSGGFYRLHKMELAGVDVRSVKNADKVRLCLGKSKRNHKDNMLMYDAYLEVIGEK